MSILGFLGSAAGQTIAGVGSTLLSNIFGASSTNKTNQNNLKINQMNNEFNERMMQKQMDYNTLMWNKQNEYNSPSAQVQRFRDAGLNPYMLMNGGSAGNAQAAGSTSPASAAGVAPQQAYHPDFSGIPQSILMAKQGQNIDADTHRQVIDNQTQGIRNMQQFANMVADTESKKVMNKLNQTILNYADQMQLEQLRNLQNQNANMLREGLLMDKNLSIFDEQTRLDFAQRAATILLTNAQTRASKQQTIHEIQKMYQTIAQTAGIKVSNDIAKRSAEHIVEKAYRDSAPQTMWSTITNGYRDAVNNVKSWLK